MATSIIKMNIAPITLFTPTPSSDITDLSSPETHCYYNASSNTVHIAIRYYSPSGLIPKANAAIAVVPAAYRPPQYRTLGTAILTTEPGSSYSGKTCAESCYIDPTGTIRLNNFLTGTAAAYAFMISSEYSIS